MGRTCARLSGVVLLLAGFGAGHAGAQTPADGWVVLPVDEYRTLRERARPPAPPPVSAIAATLTRIDYELRVDGDAIAGRALLTADVLRDGWVRVPVPAGLMVREARLDGQRLPLVEGPPPYVLLSRAGRAALDFDVVMPVTSAAGADAITLPPSQSPIVRVSLVLPRTGVDLTVSGGYIADRSEGQGDSRWTVYGQPGGTLRLSWKRKIDDRRATQPLRFRARVTQLVALGEESSQVTASLRLEVQQGTLRDVTVRLPVGLVVNQVNGVTVGDWNVTPDGLQITLLEPSITEAAVVVQGEVRTPRDGEIVVPLVRVPAAERETGGVAVDVVGAGEIAARQSRNLDPGDPSELGDIVSGRESPSMIAFRMRQSAGADERGLSVSVVRYTPQAVLVANIEEARYRTLATGDGRLLVEGQYAVRNNQRSFLKVALPAGATLWSASLAGRPLRPGVAEADAVLLPLEKGRAGAEAPTFVVTLVYVQSTAAWPARGQAQLQLPALDLPISRTVVRIHHSPRLAVALRPGPFRVDTDTGPSAEAFRVAASPPPIVNARASDLRDLPTERNVSSLLALVPGWNAHQSSVGSEIRDLPGLLALAGRYQASTARTVVGAMPVEIVFPAVGPSLFIVSELTPEKQGGVIELSIKRAR
jgi:hypothetical protein